MIVEFFGLPHSGKSKLKKRIEKEKLNVLNPLSKPQIAYHFTKHALLNPLKTTKIFFTLNTNHLKNLSKKDFLRALKMRNTYLANVLAKNNYLKQKQETIFVDEYTLQSIFMILQKKSNEKELKKLIKDLPSGDYVAIFYADQKLREKLHKKPHPTKKGTLLTGSWISKDYAKKWEDTRIHNFRILEKILTKEKEKTTSFKQLRNIAKKMTKEEEERNKLKRKLKHPKIFGRSKHNL